MNIKRTILILACIITLALCSTVSAADTTNITSNNSNSSFHSLQSSTSVNNASSQPPDPIISGVVKDNSTNKGLGNVTIRVLQNNTQVAQTKTHNDGTYSLNFINSKTSFIIIASKLGYMPISKTITVVPSSNLSDPNLYGTANFRLYNLLKYSGNASSYVLNVGVLPDILADIYAGKSSAWVNSTSLNYSQGGGTPLEVKLLTGSLLAGLLDVYSTGDEGSKVGGLLPSNNASLLSSLKLLGIDVGLLSATSNSSATLPQSNGSGEVASIDVGIKLLQLLDVLSLNADLITANSSVTPNFNTGILISSSNAGVADITLTLLGIPLLEIEALQSNAVASVNGKPGGATAKFTWNVADIKALGISILDDLTLNGHVNIGLLGLNILTLSLGSTESTTSADGTYAKASGDALRLQILGLLGGGLVNLVIGHADAEAQVPAGGLYVNTSDLEITKTVDNTRPNYLQNVTFTLKVHNNGPDTATGVTVLDKLPAGLKFISASGNGTYNSATGTWTIGSLANGGEAILNIITQVVSSNTQITNIANITGTNYDPEPGNDQANATVNVSPASDLGITKTVNKTTANYLDKIRYTLTVTNNGPDTSNNIIVNDYLPNSLQWISDNSNGAYNHNTGVWTIDALSNGASITLNIIAQIIKSNTVITNIATVNNNTYDQNPTNNQDQTTTTVSAASDLNITKTVNNTHPNYLDKVTFTITAHNNGPDTAAGVAVTDKLPAGLTWVSDNSNGAYNPTTGIWTIGNLANGESAILKIIAQITASNTQITNIAGINGTNYDQNSTNNESNSTVTVDPASDLGITKIVNNAHPNYLDKVTFTLTAHNYGSDTATGVTVLDKLPTGLKFISSNGNYDSATGVWTIGNLANGATTVLNIIAQVTASNAQITNIAGINGTNYDQNSTNNQSNTTVIINPASDLGITKTVNNSHPKYLQNVTFTLTAHNYGPNNATGVKITDKLPAGLKFISASGNGIYDSATGIWTIGSLANGATAALNIIAQAISPNTQVTNIANITGTNYDQNSTNDQDNATVNVGPASDLGIAITVNNAHPKYLDYVTFTLTAHNYGPNDAAYVKVYNTLPDKLKYVSDDSNGAFDSTTGLWTVGYMSNGATAVLHIIAQAMASEVTLTDVARITDPDPVGTTEFYDPNQDNDQASVSLDVGSAADLSITKKVNNMHPNYLDNVIFTLTVHNNGPNNATGVIATDKLPTGLKFISSNGNYDPVTGIWTIGNLANGGEAILNIIAQVITSNTQITNIAGVNGDNYDQNSTNDESNSTVIVNPASDLKITKTVNNTRPNYLENIKFTITAHNNGPDTTTGVVVLDKLPNGLKFISSNGDYDPVTGIWAVGTLTNGQEAILNIMAQVTTSNTQITNIASINGDNYDQNSSNNQSNATVIVNAASDLEITKTVNNTHPKYLQNVTYTLKVHNNGPDNATGVTVLDKLPAGLKFLSSDGNYNSTTGTWTIGNLANGATAVLNIIAQVTASNTQITNIAGVNGTNYDQNSTNNQSNITINVDLASDLGIIKTVNNSKPNYLQNVTFTLTAHNYGPNNATGVTVTDKLPTGLKFISSNGNYNSTTGTWTIGNLANGATAVLNIIAQAVSANTQVVNTANITGTNYDQNSANDQSSATVNIKPASDLGIKITVNNAHPKYLDYVTFTLTASNYGPNDAAYVKVYNTLPNKLKYISDDSNGAFDSTTGLWTVGYMSNGATAVLHIIAQAMASEVTLTDVARITDPDPVGTTEFYDPNQDNDQASVSLDVDPAADLSITKTVNSSKPNYLQNITYTLTAYNNGPNGATEVIVTDKLPAGLKFISASGNGKYSSTTGTWTIGNLANGATAVLKVVAQVVASNTQLINIASITGHELDLNATNNNANVSVTIKPASDLGITKTVNNKNPKYLQKVTFTLTAHNYGPNNATGVTVTDKLPTGLKFISSSGTGTYNSATGTWTIGNLANGATAVQKIVVQATSPSKVLTNIATIKGTNYDQKSSNNKGSASVKVGPAADLAVKMSVNNARPKYKQKVTFTITAYNYGPMNAKNVAVTLKMPKGFKYISKDKNIKYNSKTGVWTIGNLKNGGKLVLHIVAQAVVSNVRLTSTASIKGTAIMK